MKKKIRYKYKVVRLYGNIRSSITPSLLEYNIEYKKGECAKSLDKTYGIFCFKRLKDVKNFIRRNCLINLIQIDIIKVIPIGKGFCPKKIAGYAIKNNLDNFYEFEEDSPACFVPEGTICYPEVFVVD